MPGDEHLHRAREVKARHEEELFAYSGVVGVGVGFRQRGGELTSEVAIVVMVRRKRPLDTLPPGEALPPHVEDVPLDVLETGDFTANP